MLEVPVVEERLVSGDLNLSTVAMAQRRILEQEKIVGKKLSAEKKAEIVDSITRKTLEQTELELFRLLPETESAPKTFQRRVSADATRMGLTVPNDVCEQMNRLKEIWSHIDPNMDPVEIMRRAFDIALDKVDPLRRNAKRQKASDIKSKASGARRSSKSQDHTSMRTTSSTSADTNTFTNSDSNTSVSSANTDHENQNVTQQPAASVHQRVRVSYYPKELDRQLWQRAESRCEFVDPITGKRCDCKNLLQREHVIPVALGGTNELSNLQLLCRTHNLLRAREVFGDKKIDRHQKMRH